MPQNPVTPAPGGQHNFQSAVELMKRIDPGHSNGQEVLNALKVIAGQADAPLKKEGAQAARSFIDRCTRYYGALPDYMKSQEFAQAAVSVLKASGTSTWADTLMDRLMFVGQPSVVGDFLFNLARNDDSCHTACGSRLDLAVNRLDKIDDRGSARDHRIRAVELLMAAPYSFLLPAQKDAIAAYIFGGYAEDMASRPLYPGQMITAFFKNYFRDPSCKQGGEAIFKKLGELVARPEFYVSAVLKAIRETCSETDQRKICAALSINVFAYTKFPAWSTAIQSEVIAPRLRDFLDASWRADPSLARSVMKLLVSLPHQSSDTEKWLAAKTQDAGFLKHHWKPLAEYFSGLGNTNEAVKNFAKEILSPQDKTARFSWLRSTLKPSPEPDLAAFAATVLLRADPESRNEIFRKALGAQHSGGKPWIPPATETEHSTGQFSARTRMAFTLAAQDSRYLEEFRACDIRQKGLAFVSDSKCAAQFVAKILSGLAFEGKFQRLMALGEEMCRPMTVQMEVIPFLSSEFVKLIEGASPAEQKSAVRKLVEERRSGNPKIYSKLVDNVLEAGSLDAVVRACMDDLEKS